MSTAVDGQSDSNSDNSGVLAKAFNWTKALELTKALDWLWDSVLSGSKFISGSPITATPTMTPEEIGVLVDSIIRNHAMMAAGTGFLTNIGGLITLPVAIPANLAGVYAIQMRMMQEICRARGVDPKEPFMRIVARVSLVGNGALELLEETLKLAGQQIAIQLLKQLPGSVLMSINQAVGIRLLTKFGTTGVVNLGRWIPLVGGAICGGVDFAGTYAVGRAFNELLSRAAGAGGSSNPGNPPTEPNVPSCAGSEAYSQAITDPEMHRPKRKKKEFREES